MTLRTSRRLVTGLVLALDAALEQLRDDQGGVLPSEYRDLKRCTFVASGGHGRPISAQVPDVTDDAGVLLCTYDQAAGVLGTSSRTVRRLVKDGRLPVVRIGSAPRIRRADLDVFVQELEPEMKEPSAA